MLRANSKLHQMPSPKLLLSSHDIIFFHPTRAGDANEGVRQAAHRILETLCRIAPADILTHLSVILEGMQKVDLKVKSRGKGPLCVACAKNYVLFGGKCIICDGGSPLWAGVVGLSGVALVLSLIHI